MCADESTPRRRGRPKKIQRDDVLEAAMAQYWREGVHALSLNEVCRRVSVSKPYMYREFDGEDGLLEAVLGHYRDAVVGPVVAFLGEERPFADSLEGIIVGMTSPRDHPPGCLFTEMRLLRGRLGPRSSAMVDAVEAERRRAFERWYATAMEAGEANTSLTVEEAARYIDGQFSSALLQLGAGEPADAVRAQARLALSVLVA